MECSFLVDASASARLVQRKSRRRKRSALSAEGMGNKRCRLKKCLESFSVQKVKSGVLVKCLMVTEKVKSGEVFF